MKRLLLVIVAAMVCTGCYTEVRNGEVWACEPGVGCINTGMGAS